MIVVSSSASIVCALVLIFRFLLSKKASSTPIARMISIKSFCDLIVATKFLLAIFIPSHSSTTPWCFLQYTIGQLVALISCCYNAIICVALYFVFSRFSSAPLLDIVWVISPGNQVVMLGFCVSMWLIPLYHHQWGLMSDNHGDCWIPDSETTPGQNVYRLTFFVPLIVFNAFAIRLLVLVYNRRTLFQNENRFLLIRLAFFVTVFLIQWICYFAAAVGENGGQKPKRRLVSMT